MAPQFHLERSASRLTNSHNVPLRIPDEEPRLWRWENEVGSVDGLFQQNRSIASIVSCPLSHQLSPGPDIGLPQSLSGGLGKVGGKHLPAWPWPTAQQAMKLRIFRFFTFAVFG